MEQILVIMDTCLKCLKLKPAKMIDKQIDLNCLQDSGRFLFTTKNSHVSQIILLPS